jgi:short subunit dehydrogenase-like uncharacterized protein
MPERDFSVVVFGAGGVTGRGVAAYLAERAGEVGASWAVAGRDPAKLEHVLGELGVTAPETIAADVGDPASLAAMASRATVVLDLVGPYTLYGEPVIDACVAGGAHYVDLTGEMPFARRMIDTYGERAEAAGVKVVETCGFEALPPDICVALAARIARERWDEDLDTVDLAIETRQPAGRLGLADFVSGGTLQSTAEAIGGEGAGDLADPAALIPDPALAAEVRARSPIPLAPRVSARGEMLAPMTPAAFINPAVIQRTAMLTAAEFGRDPHPPRYREGIVLPGGGPMPLRYAAAASLSATQAGFRALSHANPRVRERAAAALRKLLPGSGFGPKGERLHDWSWRVDLEARTTGGRHVHTQLDADGHPGYLATSKMLGETGLMLAEEGLTPERGGCLTPATALGTDHLDRFEPAGLRFAVVS